MVQLYTTQVQLYVLQIFGKLETKGITFENHVALINYFIIIFQSYFRNFRLMFRCSCGFFNMFRSTYGHHQVHLYVVVSWGTVLFHCWAKHKLKVKLKLIITS
jgi:hypothetical protein